jgi:hypothetical protein
MSATGAGLVRRMFNIAQTLDHQWGQARFNRDAIAKRSDLFQHTDRTPQGVRCLATEAYRARRDGI